MSMPFPGMDPYLEHPILWTAVHTRLINVISQQLGPRLRPRYVTSIEERDLIDIHGKQRVPDVWVQKASELQTTGGSASALAEPVILEVPQCELKEHYIEIMDRYQDLKVVTVIEVVSPTNKASGDGRDAYEKKRNATLASDTHLVEIDLTRAGDRLGHSAAQLKSLGNFDYLILVNRYPYRTRSESYSCRLRERLPCFGIPLVHPDPDVALDLQAALQQVYEDGSYMLRVKYDEPCDPPLNEDDQRWANHHWELYRSQHPELFGTVV